MVKGDNSFGTASVILGILSIVFASIPGLIIGITAFVFATKQKKISNNKWVKAGTILAIIGIILSIIVLILNIWIQYNPELAAQALSQYS